MTNLIRQIIMERKSPPVLCIIVPCYIEAPVLRQTNLAIDEVMAEMVEHEKISPYSFMLFVDDRSTDDTWEVIKSMRCEFVRGIRLAHHSGHQIALVAGMEYAVKDFDCCVTIDADLQDDVNVIPEMVAAYSKGADIVYGVRKSRKTDCAIKRMTANGFYRLMNGLGVDCVSNHADFRLMSKRAVEDLLEFDERNLFLRGIVPRIGYDQAVVFYERKERAAGVSKYPFWKMLDFAADGITSFSVLPVRMLFWLGLAFTAIGLGIGVYSLIRYFIGETIEGWTSLMLSIWFCTGMLLMGLGVTGEYIGKIYIEVKHRPRYKISDET